MKLEAHADAMLFHSVALIGDTEDGVSFKGFGVKSLVEILEKQIPRWA